MKIIVTKEVSKEVIDKAATGSRAKAARLARGWTYRQAAAKLDCSFSYLADLENGIRSWTGKIGKRYARLLGN